MADVNTGLLQTLDGPGPQFKDAKNPDTMKWHEGDKAPYMQIVDTAGNPISSTNKMPVDVDGQSINVGNTVSTQLTGRNVEDVLLLSTSITVTSNVFSESLDFSKYKSFVIIVSNTHDQAIDVWPVISDESGGFVTKYYDGTAFQDPSANPLTIPPSGIYDRFIIDKAWPYILDQPERYLRFGFHARTAPTGGTVELYVKGVPN